MAVTINGVVCQELVDGYTESYSFREGPSCRKGYLCSWSQRFQALRGILGLSSVYSVGGIITLNAPMPYPELANLSTNPFSSDYALNVEIIPVGSPTQGTLNVQWPYAKLYVTFGPFPWSWSGVDFMQIDPNTPYIWIEQHINYSSEFITIPKGKAYWKTTPVQTDADFGFQSPLAELTFTLKNIPYLPAQTVIAAMQRPINQYTYLNVSPGYLLFNGGRDDPAHVSDGTPARDVQLSFLYRSIAQWDQAWNSGISNWDQVVDVNGNAILKRSDLSQIIPAAYQG